MLRHLSASLLLLAATAVARADEIETQPTVQVTASRVPETVDSTLADVTVITRDEIDASASRDVLDLLRLQAGVDLYRTGGAGQQTSLFLRGTNANHVLVLIDGVRASSANTGAFAFEWLPLDAVERIEIVRGPRASYWGSDAIGGVIQIFTRKLDGPRVAAGYGTYDDAAGAAGIGHWDGQNGYTVQVGARHVGGFSATNPSICNGPDDPSRIRKMIQTTRQAATWRPMPVLINEDDHFRFGDPDNHLLAALSAYTSWGYFEPGLSNYVDGHQCPPVNWGINTERKREFFAKLKEITGA